MLFKYSGINKSGKKVSAKIEASSLQIAKANLKKQDIIFTSIKEIQESKQFFSFNRKIDIKQIDLSNISKDIAVFLNAGISLINSIKMLANQYEHNPKLKLFFESLTTLLNEGKTFHQTLILQNVYQLPPFYLQSIKVSENGGLLNSVLLELSSFIKEQEKIKKEITSAMIYPLFLLSVAFLMIGFLITTVVPKISSVFDSLGQELPYITQIVINMSDFLTIYWSLIIIIVIIIISTFSLIYKQNSDFKYKIDLLVLKIPFINTMIEASALSQFSYITSLLINSGVTLAQAIQLSSEVLSNAALKKAFINSAKRVVEGERLSNVLKKQAINIDKSFIQALALGEETSQVDLMLKNLASMYKEKNSDKITILLSLMEPMMMLLVGGFVGFIVVAMLLPIFSMNIG